MKFSVSLKKYVLMEYGHRRSLELCGNPTNEPPGKLLGKVKVFSTLKD